MDAKCTSYVEQVFKSIKKNVGTLRGQDDALQGLIEAVQKFYVSLFGSRSVDGTTAFFGRKDMDAQLSKGPSNVRAAESAPPSEEEDSTRQRPKKALGAGTGLPGRRRKVQVSKRQQRARDSDEFRSRKRKSQQPRVSPTASSSTASSTSSVSQASQPPPRKTPRKAAAPRRLAPRTGSPPPPPTAAAAAATTTTTTTTSREPPTAEQREPRQELRLQTSRQAGQKRVQMIQQVCGGERDSPPNGDELQMFWTMMDGWGRLDARLVVALHGVWNDLIDDDALTFTDKILRLAAVRNGVTNCVQHLVGTLVKRSVENDESQAPNLVARLEALEDETNDHQYAQYVRVLRSCGCQPCKDVLQFDDKYKR